MPDREEVITALKKLGGCICDELGIDDVGLVHDCPKHGKIIVESFEVTSFGDSEPKYITGIRDA